MTVHDIFQVRKTTMIRRLVPILIIGLAVISCECPESSRSEDRSPAAPLKPPYKPVGPLQVFLIDLKDIRGGLIARAEHT